MASNKSRKFDPQGRLVEQRECNLAVLVPVPVSERVEALTEALDRDGHGRVARKELVGALLFGATTDTGELAELLRRYRTARVRDALVGDAPSGKVISFPQRAPGPRPRGS
jgi:hypothetical protein